jgi:hypothetical protein
VVTLNHLPLKFKRAAALSEREADMKDKREQAEPRCENEDGKPLGCRGFIRGICNNSCRRLKGDRLKECHDYLKRYARIPHAIIDIFMPQTTGDEWKILEYVLRHADFNPSSHNYGKAFLKYADITSTTNIKQPRKPLARLEKLGLIHKIHKRYRSKEGVKTGNTIIVRWMKPLKKLSDEKPELPKAKPAPGGKSSANRPITFERFIEQHNVDRETTSAIEYYLNTFQKRRGEKHPNLRIEQWAKHTETFRQVSVNGQEETFDAGSLEVMINKYFDTEYQAGCDYRIHHFNTLGIKEHLVYGSKLY